MPGKVEHSNSSKTRHDMSVSDQSHIFGQLMRSQLEATPHTALHEPEVVQEHPIDGEVADPEEHQ